METELSQLVHPWASLCVVNSSFSRVHCSCISLLFLEGLKGRVSVPETPLTMAKNIGVISKHLKEKKKKMMKKISEAVPEPTTSWGRGRKPRVFMKETDIVFRHEKAVQTVTNGSSLSDIP